ncbi:MAG: copper chaperone PCu(A)C [Alphaproteobacteria bacterium]|nr:copper chaperone PCu(A)C [Alphaproteobacteria bacterium]
MAKSYFTFACFVILLVVTACEEKGDPRVMVTDAWAPASAEGATTAAIYFTLKNTGAAGDTLIGAKTYEADSVSLHDAEKDGDVMKMKPVDGILIPKREEVALTPGGLHLMLVDLTKPLTEGSMITVTLQFKKSPDWTLQVPIKAMDAAGP